MKYAVVTGSSRGLGEGIVRHLLNKRIHVIGIARKENTALAEYAAEQGVSYRHETCDLSNTAEVNACFKKLAIEVFSSNSDQIYLINNAGVVDPIDTAANYEIEALERHIRINLTAPMAAVNLFLKQSRQQQKQLTVVNVTSGAAERSVHGWSAYSTTKAGLNRFTETVALEEDTAGSGNISIAYNPGIMDTGMQEEIRSSDAEAFQDVQRFKDYVTQNALRDPYIVGGVLVDILTGEEAIVNGKNYSVKDYLA